MPGRQSHDRPSTHQRTKLPTLRECAGTSSQTARVTFYLLRSLGISALSTVVHPVFPNRWTNGCTIRMLRSRRDLGDGRSTPDMLGSIQSVQSVPDRDGR